MSAIPDAGRTSLSGVLTLSPKVFVDGRGHFLEVFNTESFADATGLSVKFVQDNESESVLGTVRGIHYQLPPREQGKLVRVVAGAVFDVAVDLRRSSDSFGNWFGTVLSQDNHLQQWIPSGFGHGFLALTEAATVIYKTTDLYSRGHDRTIRWDDPAIGIAWPTDGVGDVRVSDRDTSAPLLQDAEVFA
jgi:dTDP-4-dehydrorhamnose 3,5-epimerase